MGQLAPALLPLSLCHYHFVPDGLCPAPSNTTSFYLLKQVIYPLKEIYPVSGTWKLIKAIINPCGFSSVFCTQYSFSSTVPQQECSAFPWKINFPIGFDWVCIPSVLRRTQSLYTERTGWQYSACCTVTYVICV